MNQTPIQQNVKCTVIQCDIQPISHYTKRTWISANYPFDGNDGYWQTTKKRYRKTKLDIIFIAQVDTTLRPSGVYFDGINNFYAISPTEITLVNHHIDSFSIPKSLILLYSTHSNKSDFTQQDSESISHFNDNL